CRTAVPADGTITHPSMETNQLQLSQVIIQFRATDSPATHARQVLLMTPSAVLAAGMTHEILLGLDRGYLQRRHGLMDRRTQDRSLELCRENTSRPHRTANFVRSLVGLLLVRLG